MGNHSKNGHFIHTERLCLIDKGRCFYDIINFIALNDSNLINEKGNIDTSINIRFIASAKQCSTGIYSLRLLKEKSDESKTRTTVSHE